MLRDDGCSLLVVDCQYDFIDGSLACLGAVDAVRAALSYINAHPSMPVLYSADWHGPENHSFAKHGGLWPSHCVAGERGSQIHEAFSSEVCNEAQRPSAKTLYRKGTDDAVEEYSAIAAKNEAGRAVAQDLGLEVMVCGIASEFCVRESVLDLLKTGRRVVVLTDALGYVDAQNHEENLKDLERRGAILQKTS